LFWLLEECRISKSFQQIIVIGGDAAMGHFFYPHAVPVTEQQGHSAYPGCYALSKVLEEVMLEQYFIQYNIAGCCLRAPWIMEKDDFKYSAHPLPLRSRSVQNVLALAVVTKFRILRY
jgi:UDP-glucose 4-epimerase